MSSVDTLKPFLIYCHRIIGFLVGFAAAASYSATHLLQEYKQASEALQSAVDELQRNTEKVYRIIYTFLDDRPSSLGCCACSKNRSCRKRPEDIVCFGHCKG